jgi:hypothetical protein
VGNKNTIAVVVRDDALRLLLLVLPAHVVHYALQCIRLLVLQCPCFVGTENSFEFAVVSRSRTGSSVPAKSGASATTCRTVSHCPMAML